MTNTESTDSNTSNSSSFTSGQKLAGVYVLRRQTSPEGAAAIWLAHDEVLGKDVTLHFVPAAVREDSRAMGELRHEVKRNRQLIHPNILRVYDLIEEADWAAISMDPFEGETLAALKAKKESGFFEPSDLKPWIQQLCLTLEDVHKIQIVHRNVSPSNLIIDGAGKLTVANFGISRVIEDAIGRARQKEGGAEQHLVFMSPQQLDGETPTRVDDVYSAGVTLYELLTGTAPFAGGDLVPQIRKSMPEAMMERRAKNGKRGGTILPVWEKAVASSLAKNPADRPQSAAEFAVKLGLSGRAAAGGAEAAAATVATKPEPTVKKNEAWNRKAGKSGQKGGAPAIERAGAAEKSAPPRVPEPDLAAAVAAELAKPGNEKNGKSKNRPIGETGVPDIYPSLYPRRSKFPLTGVAMAVVLAGIGLSYYYFNKQAQDSQNPDSEPAMQTTENWRLAQVNNADVGPAGAELPAGESPKQASPPELVPANASTTPGEPRLTDPTVAVAPTTPAPTVSAHSEPLLAATTKKVKGSPTPVTATPGFATLPATGAAPASGDPGMTGKREAVDKARRAAEIAEKARQDAVKRQQSAEAELTAAQKALDDKTKAAAQMMKGAEDLSTQRQQREEQLKTAELAAQQARQLAEEKVRGAEDAKKALTEWEAANKPKLAARDKADADIQAVQKALAEKQRTATDATKGAADAEIARTQQMAALQQSEAALQRAEDEEKQARMAMEKAAAEKAAAEKVAAEKAAAEQARMAAEKAAAEKAAKLSKEYQGIEEMRKELDERLRRLKEQIDASSAPAAPPGPTPIPPKPRPPGASAEPATPAATTTVAMNTAPVVPVVPPPEKPVDAAGVSKTIDAQAGFENSLGMRFVPVAGTETSFCIWPARLKDFEVYARETGLKSTGWRSPGFKQGPDHPVVNVTWTEAVGFCRWLSDRERKKGALTASQSFRLPTDLEWSKAAGLPEEPGRTPEARDMGVPDLFPWGTQWPPPPNVGNYTGEETGSDVAIKGYDDGFAWTSPVGSFPPNKFGLYDMGGNVWQWCQDSWNAESKSKVLRGASWYNGALRLSLLSSCRVHANPDSSTDNYGFRVVLARGAEAGKTSKR